MRRIVALLFVIGFSCSTLFAEPIENIFHPFPEGTILYKAFGATLTTLSSIKSNASEDQLKFTFQGIWELNSELQGVSVTPESGVIIVAVTAEEKKKLIEIESMLKKRGNQKIDIYVLSGSVNRDEVTYSGPETIRFD